LLVVVALLGGELGQGRAADIQTSQDTPCAFKLDGTITSGDHDRLAAVIAGSRLDPLDDRTTALCLKSPGGSYTEGLKISELIYNRGISTIVVDGTECFSACALIFMSGVLPDRAVPYRKLSGGGLLGFHAPYLSLAEGEYSKDHVEDAAQAMRVAALASIPRRATTILTNSRRRPWTANGFGTGLTARK
jgi:hypothetical protein